MEKNILTTRSRARPSRASSPPATARRAACDSTRHPPELNKNLFFTTNLEQSISEADMIFISVNTPTKTKGIGAGKASDISWVEACTRQVAKYAVGDTIVVEKSTIPVRTAEAIKAILENSKRDNKDKCSFSVLSNPEFLAEGTAIKDLQNPDRILIGGEDASSIQALKDIYLNWVKEEKIITTNLWNSKTKFLR
mgnify:CR=1 FL=1